MYKHFILGALLCLVGCAAEARVVRRDVRGGELMLRGPSANAVLEARGVIVEHCGGRYRLQNEGSSQVSASNDIAGHGRLSYRCGTGWAPSTAELAQVAQH
jgi:hypothetical protein